jgi:hypothetical protein
MNKRATLGKCLMLRIVSAAAGAPAQSPRGDARLCETSAAPRTYPSNEGFLDVDGLFLYYREIGEGEPLIVLHGGPGGSHN